MLRSEIEEVKEIARRIAKEEIALALKGPPPAEAVSAAPTAAEAEVVAEPPLEEL